jgi:hypothetical protein
MSCVLRVSGEFLPQQFLAESPWAAESVWQRGEQRGHGPAASESGFTVVVSDAGFDELATQVQDAAAFLRRHGSEFARLRATTGVSEPSLDFGVAQRIHPAWSLCLSAEFIELAGRCGVGVELSLYAVSGAGGFA